MVILDRIVVPSGLSGGGRRGNLNELFVFRRTESRSAAIAVQHLSTGLGIDQLPPVNITSNIFGDFPKPGTMLLGPTSLRILHAVQDAAEDVTASHPPG